MSGDVTDADRETAVNVAAAIIDGDETTHSMVTVIATALAAEREKVRAPFRELANMVERDALEGAEPHNPDGAEHVRACALLLVAHSIRRAAEEG